MCIRQCESSPTRVSLAFCIYPVVLTLHIYCYCNSVFLHNLYLLSDPRNYWARMRLHELMLFFNTLRPKHDGWYFACGILERMLLEESSFYSDFTKKMSQRWFG